MNITSYKVIRENYFDPASFDIPKVDTNKVDVGLIRQIDKDIKLENSTKYLLIETLFEHVPVREYKLYDFKNDKYYKASTKDVEFTFKETKDTTTLLQIKKIKEDADNFLQKAVTSIRPQSQRNDFGYFIVSIIDVDALILHFKSYYLHNL